MSQRTSLNKSTVRQSNLILRLKCKCQKAAPIPCVYVPSPNHNKYSTKEENHPVYSRITPNGVHRKAAQARSKTHQPAPNKPSSPPPSQAAQQVRSFPRLLLISLLANRPKITSKRQKKGEKENIPHQQDTNSRPSARQIQRPKYFHHLFRFHHLSCYRRREGKPRRA